MLWKWIYTERNSMENSVLILWLNPFTFLCRLPAGYCFIDFHDPENAHQAMLKLNGKNIPNSSPVGVYQGQSSDPELGQYQTKLTANLSPTDDLYHVLNFIRQGQFSSVEYRLDSFLFPQSRLLMVFWR